MKKQIVILIMVACMLFMINTADAASSLSVSSSSVTVGGTFTITARVSNVASWGMNVSVTGPAKYVSGTLQDANTTDNALNGSKTITAKYQVTGAGTITVSFTGDATHENGIDTETITINKTVVGKAKVVAPVTTPTKTTTTTKTPTVTTKKSSEARLNALTVNVEGLTPSFNKDKTSYKLNVDNSVNKLIMTLSLKDNKATYKITGNKDFKLGENIVKIKVTAENRTTTKTYTIKVNKTPDLTLSSLTVSNAELMKEFDPNVLEYKLKDITEDIKKLDINAATTSDAATVKIAGNDSLVAGENIIKIVVSDESGKYTRVYTLIVNKIATVPVISENVEDVGEVVEQDSLMEEIIDFLGMKDEKIRQNITIVALYLLSLLEFIQVIYLYKQLKTINPDFDKITRRGQVNKDSIPARRRAVDIDIDTESNPGVNLDDNKEK